MKKMLDNRFLFILALSLIVLIVLGVGAFYLFDNSDATFVKSGYVINPLSTKTEKYFFDENTSYRENLSSMVEFNDVDSNKVTVLKDSFLHYMDGSLSFLKNGAILDLDSIKGNDAVAFYNITKDSIIEKKDNGYVIKTTGDDINLKNFIGRINDNKYIVVGSLEAKIPGNNTNISGNYFEIVYTEEGVVNIENKDVKYQVTAEGTIIYVGNMAIDLGDKKITKNGADVMSLTAITINGDENVEIIPAPKEKEEEKPEEPTPEPTPTPNEPNNNQGDGGEGEGGNETPNKEETMVTLKSAHVTSTSVEVVFDIYNEHDDDSFTLRVSNLDSGRTVDMFSEVVSDANIIVNLLSPNTKYLFSVINERDGGKYFQKIFETNDFGIKLERNYATDGELSFKVIVDEGTDITDATLSLYKYNEDTGRNEIATSSYVDANTNEIKYVNKVVKLSSLEGNIEGSHDIIFDGLESNTIYTAVLDEFSVVSSNFKDIYNITLNTMTLKKTPSLHLMNPVKNISNASFKLALENIVDPDNAIVSFTYLIYERDNLTNPVINPIVKKNIEPIEIKVGTGENQLRNDTNYFYKVIVEYNDNEKLIEYSTGDSINFVMGSEPHINVIPDYSKTTYDEIFGTIHLIDTGCMISMPRCNAENSLMLYLYKIDGMGDKTLLSKKEVAFVPTDDDVYYDFNIAGLEENAGYTIDIWAIRIDDENAERVKIEHTPESTQVIRTKSLSALKTDWEDEGSNSEHVVNVTAKFVPDVETGSVSPEQTAEAIKKVVIKIYEGRYSEDLVSRTPLATKAITREDMNLKEAFYDNGYLITTDETFGYDIDALRARNMGNLSEYYTITIDAYYDDFGVHKVDLDAITEYKISPLLLMDNITEPTIKIVEEVTKESEEEINGRSYITEKLNDIGTIVGYDVLAVFDREGLLANSLYPQNINMYVFDEEKHRVDFYVREGNNLILTNTISKSLGESSYYQDIIYIDYGTEYGANDAVMSRGHKYYIGYTIDVEADGETIKYPINYDTDRPYGFGVYTQVTTEKETPHMNMYITKSTVNSINYKYSISDPDKAIYRESGVSNFYYTIAGGDEEKVALVPKIDDSDAFAGTMTISGLSNGNSYTLYYKKNVTKTGNASVDIVPYFDSEDNGTRIFDGYYDAKDAGYNFKFTVINNPLVDNRVIIKILATDEIINRIVSYKLTFTDLDKANVKLERELWKLTDCGEEEPLNRCFSINYIDLKEAGMKGDTIQVSVEALYDNGLTGFDYTVGNNKDYEYMILQNNLTSNGGDYISFTKSGRDIEKWNALASDVGRGYYTYSFVGNQISYTVKASYFENIKNVDSYKGTKPIGFSLSSQGYMSNYGTLNPKMISSDTMVGETSTFSFSSITPKVAKGKTTSMINGAMVDLTLWGADITEFCEDASGNNCVNENNSKFYLYVDVWDDAEKVGNFDYVARPRLSFEINKENPGETITAKIDLLSEGKTYYYNVYAYMNKNGRKVYTHLFDFAVSNKFETKTYDFTTLTAIDIFHNYDVNFHANLEGNYGDRLLDTTINLIAYENSVPFNFDVSYAFCEYGDTNCGVLDGDNNIFKNTIPVNKVSTSFTDSFDISSFDLEYGKSYYMYIYAKFNYYETNDNLTEKVLLLNRRTVKADLRKLVKPDFVVSREANYINGDYVISFVVNVDDIDRTLVDGVYYIKLLDENSNVVGDLQVINDGDYVTVGNNGDYLDYELDATVSNKAIRIKGLNEDTKYTVMVYNDAYINNYDGTNDSKIVDINKKHTVFTTNSGGVAFGDMIEYSATQKTVVVTFLGGSKFDNVLDMSYTIGHWDNNINAVTYTGSYDIENGPKKFEPNDEGDWQFIIEPAGMDNAVGSSHSVQIDFHVRNPETDEIIHYYYDKNNPKTFRFNGIAQYVKDTK